MAQTMRLVVLKKSTHIFAPCGNTGLSHVMGTEKEVSDLGQLYMDNPFLECILNQQN